ncbi:MULTISPECIES: ROK family protein [unclassified Oceanispirochaeta]|uniref:ROK family transcriptional regulator n=1 Tax=unclassified Oceanispirochaeta TaxID=2635722 RepID=UPI0013147F01|nr:MULTISPECIES: ROK family protein [unclassified Oceanispirochaeta]MBF9017221.1 ROK family protein [Oceanispirochaeta sp. M2]NPD73670.1 ROK family protein [Oceanispirochaeta sp. M1]
MTSNKVQEGKINRSRTIELIRNRPGISRIEASDSMGLNRSTLTHIVNDLLDFKLITEQKSARAGERVGRIPIGLSIVERPILGIEWQDHFMRFSLQTLTGKTLHQGQVELLDHGIDNFKDELLTLIPELEREHHCRIYGVGIGLPGRINPHKGIALESLPLELNNYPLAEVLEKELKIPVLLENDANCFAWGEIGDRKEFKGNLLCMLLEFHSNPQSQTWDQEVGIGVVTGGEVYHGSSYSAGELQVSPVIDSLRNDFLKILNSDKHENTVASLEYTSLLFRTLSPVISTLDPELLILGGDFYLHKTLLEPALKKVIPFNWKFSQKGIWEVAEGAASFFIKTIFTLPGFDDEAAYKGAWEEILIEQKKISGGSHV